MPSEFGSTVVVARPENRELEGATLLDIKRQSWYANVGIRAARTFLQSFVALGSILFVATMVTDLSNYEQWLQTAFLLSFGKKVLICLIVAFVTALWSVAQNLLELLTKLDSKKPELRG